jgi:hypothetical protein
LKIDNEIAKCLIIYPNKEKTSNDLSNLWNDGEEIQGFHLWRSLRVDAYAISLGQSYSLE